MADYKMGNRRQNYILDDAACCFTFSITEVKIPNFTNMFLTASERLFVSIGNTVCWYWNYNSITIVIVFYTFNDVDYHPTR